MKIIKASVDLKAWALPCTCAKCRSELEICNTDVRYKWASNIDSCFYYKCILCDYINHLESDDVPELVKTDIKKNRSDPSPPCSDW